VYSVVPLRGGELELRFGAGAVRYGRIRAGDLLWRTHDVEVDRAARPYLEANAPVQKQGVRVAVTAHAGAALQLAWQLVERPEVAVVVQADAPLGAAQKRALDAPYLREQLGRLGGTPYALVELTLDVQGNPFAPSSLLNQLRREAVAQLAALQAGPPVREVREPLAALATLTQHPHDANGTQERATPQLHLLVRTPEQLDAAIAERPASITLDYLELYGLRPAVERVQAAGIVARVASPRVLKPSEERVVHFLRKLECAILVRSGGLLTQLAEGAHPPLIGDFSLNVANTIAAETFLALGVERVTPTHDLNAAQVAALAEAVGGEQIEAIAYQHLPVFHTEHCVFCRFLSTGTSYKDCGHPCEQHRVALRDQHGRAHPVMADVGCRNTVFGAEAQEASRHLQQWLDAGVRHMRLEFVHESAAQLAAVVQSFRAALDGSLPYAELTRALQHLAPQGSTEGSLFVPSNYQMIPLMQ
jgi:U32 family peptidase